MFRNFLITVFLTIFILHTYTQPSLCLYFSTKITQRSLWAFGIVHTHHIKITYIVTSVNIISFSDSGTMLFVYFLNTNNLSGYLMAPFFQGGVVQSPFLRPSPDYHSTSHSSTSTQLHPYITYVRTKFLLKQSTY